MSCSICCEAYDSGDHVPRVLQCGHTFCTLCLHHLARSDPSDDSKDTFPCSICKALDRRPVSELPPSNYDLIDAAHLDRAAELNSLLGRAGSNSTNISSQQFLRLWLDERDLQLSPTELGTGATGKVVEGKYQGQQVAVKVIDLSDAPKSTHQALVREMAAVLRVTDECRHTCRYKGVALKGNKFCLVMKRYAKSLAKVLADDGAPPNGVPLSRLTCYATQALGCLVELHNLKIVMADLKPQNLLLDEALDELVVTDFGLSRNISSTVGSCASTVAGGQGTPHYMPPEQFNVDETSGSPVPLTPAADMWSWACTVIHMATGQQPFANLAAHHITIQVGVHKKAPAIPPTLPESMRELLAKCLSGDPSQRPSAELALQALISVPSAAAQTTSPDSPAGRDSSHVATVGIAVGLLVVAQKYALMAAAAVLLDLATKVKAMVAATTVLLLYVAAAVLLLQLVARVCAMVVRAAAEAVPVTGPVWHSVAPAAPPAIAVIIGHQPTAPMAAEVATTIQRLSGMMLSDTTSKQRALSLAWPEAWSCKQMLEGHTDELCCCSISPDGRTLVSGSWDKTLRVWDLNNGRFKLKRTLKGHTDAITCCSISPDGRTMVSGSFDTTLKVWDLDKGSCRHTLEGHTNPGLVSCCSISPDGRTLVSAADDGTLAEVRVWDLDKGSCRHRLGVHTGFVSSCSISPDGHTLVWTAGSARGGTLRVWDLKEGSCRHTLKGHTDWLKCCSISPDGRTLVSGSKDTTLKVWDLKEGSCRHTLEGHTDELHCCSISPDGHTLVSGSWDKTLKVWDLDEGSCTQTLKGHTGVVSCCSISRDGCTLTSGCFLNNTLTVWQRSSHDARAAA